MHIPNRPEIWIARVAGILAIATGFVLGIEGLQRPESIWLAVALGFIVAGLCAQVYAFSRALTDRMASRDHRVP